MQYRWNLRPAASAGALAALSDFPPLMAQLLHNRGLRDNAQAHAFLGRGETLSLDPFLLPDMEAAVARLEQAGHRKEPVVVYGDFDADGITGTALLVQGLRPLGLDARPYIPHREREGYGLHNEALQRLYAEGARLVISVDCGTSSLDEIATAAALGLDVVVADHHAIPPQLPPAVAIINPHRSTSRYPFQGFCGAGVAFKLLQALYSARGRPLGALEEVLDLVAIATVADVAPLRDENRWMVQRGLEALNQGRRLGLRALLRQAGIHQGRVDASDLGFMIAPRLNAMGRLEHALASYQLLTTEDPQEAEALAEQLEATNRARQLLTQQAVDRARAELEERGGEEPLVMVAGPDYPAGVIGLVASRLAEERYRPAVVVEVGPELSRGSARSIPEFSIVGALAECSDLFARYGGHPQAAGFTLQTARLPELRARLNEIAARELDGRGLEPSIRIDAETSLRGLPGPVVQFIRQLGPFGPENPEPLFLSRRLAVAEMRAIGSAGSHLELKLRHEGATWRAVGFGMGGRAEEIGEKIDLVYSLSVDRWQGQDLLQLRMRDLRPA